MAGSHEESWSKQRFQHFLEENTARLRQQIRVDRRWRHVLDVDDVLQVTYLEAFQSFHELRDSSSKTLLGWLANSARNNLRDAVRALSAAGRTDGKQRARPDREECVNEFWEQLRMASTTPSRACAARELRSRLQAAVKRLPTSYRAVVGAMLEGREVWEIAQDLGCSNGAVYMMRARACNRLRALLGPGTLYFEQR